MYMNIEQRRRQGFDDSNSPVLISAINPFQVPYTNLITTISFLTLWFRAISPFDVKARVPFVSFLAVDYGIYQIQLIVV